MGLDEVVLGLVGVVMGFSESFHGLGWGYDGSY